MNDRHLTMRRTMARLFFFLGLILFADLFFSRCIVAKTRWNDKKAEQVFKTKNVPLVIADTVINDHHIHYAISGNADRPTLVFIHGSPGSWFHYMKYMWDEDLRKKYRIVSIDRPGFGFSDYGKAIHLQDQCKLLLPVLQSLKGDQPMFLCGHSYGGPVVAKLAADAPSLFKTIVITSGSIDPSQEKKETWRHIMDKKPFFWFLPGAFQPSNTELLYLKEDLKPLASDLDKITTNVVFIHGDKDDWVPIENIAYSQKKMVHASSITIDTLKGAGHQIPWKNREEFKKILLNLE
ncbi:MAG TPA: alpha/beta hydrolase [Chitinophagaceae bacterium]|nr:alpha/beta hydrolase [Chitinophagaceae bacterium]